MRSIDRWVLGVLRFNRPNQALEISKCKVSVEGRDTTYSSLLKRYHNKLNQVCTTERRSQTAAVVMFYLPFMDRLHFPRNGLGLVTSFWRPPRSRAFRCQLSHLWVAWWWHAYTRRSQIADQGPQPRSMHGLVRASRWREPGGCISTIVFTRRHIDMGTGSAIYIRMRNGCLCTLYTWTWAAYSSANITV